MTNWYDKVSKDVNNIPDAVAYYESELLQAKKETNITRLLAEKGVGPAKTPPIKIILIDE